MTKFAIIDIGTVVTGTIDKNGVHIENAGGCPAESILRGVRNFSDPQKLANALLNRWVGGGGGYEGGWEGAKENKLYVSVKDGGATASA